MKGNIYIYIYMLEENSATIEAHQNQRFRNIFIYSYCHYYLADQKKEKEYVQQYKV